VEIDLHYNTPVHFSRTKPYKDFLVQHCRLGMLRHTYTALGFDLDTEDRNQLNCKENITPWKYLTALFSNISLTSICCMQSAEGSQDWVPVISMGYPKDRISQVIEMRLKKY
jgi:hypothetical protein